MIGFAKWKIHSIAGIIAAAGLVSGCTQTGSHSKLSANLTKSGSKTYAYTPKDKECLERAMFFEIQPLEPGRFDGRWHGSHEPARFR